MSRTRISACSAGRRPDESDQRAPDQSADIAHWSDYQPIRRRPSANFEFPVGTRVLHAIVLLHFTRRIYRKAWSTDHLFCQMLTACSAGFPSYRPSRSYLNGSFGRSETGSTRTMDLSSTVLPQCRRKSSPASRQRYLPQPTRRVAQDRSDKTRGRVAGPFAERRAPLDRVL
jgi:hypothetical protein